MGVRVGRAGGQGGGGTKWVEWVGMAGAAAVQKYTSSTFFIALQYPNSGQWPSTQICSRSKQAAGRPREVKAEKLQRASSRLSRALAGCRLQDAG